ncbi:chaplin [Streptomyces sp. NPDC046197]|uniref:chaplin n=1 Tax=Streptomyces sp. NPDC046197 TaxID=3154337 RepID=UPI0033F7F919
MKRVTRNGVIAVAAASGAMAVTVPMSAAFAADGGAAADGAAAGSPGLISGNTIQLPVHLPVNVCGNTVSVVGLLNPASGNRCANESSGSDRAPSAGRAGRATASGSGKDSPGVLSGNGIQLPVHVPVNVSGNSVSVVGVGNPAVGNSSTNSGSHPDQPAPQPVAPPRAQPAPAPRPMPHPAPRTQASLAHTGTDLTVPAVAASAAFVLGGTALCRRFRPRASR